MLNVFSTINIGFFINTTCVRTCVKVILRHGNSGKWHFFGLTHTVSKTVHGGSYPSFPAKRIVQKEES